MRAEELAYREILGELHTTGKPHSLVKLYPREHERALAIIKGELLERAKAEQESAALDTFTGGDPRAFRPDIRGYVGNCGGGFFKYPPFKRWVEACEEAAADPAKRSLPPQHRRGAILSDDGVLSDPHDHELDGFMSDFGIGLNGCETRGWRKALEELRPQVLRGVLWEAWPQLEGAREALSNGVPAWVTEEPDPDDDEREQMLHRTPADWLRSIQWAVAEWEKIVAGAERELAEIEPEVTA